MKPSGLWMILAAGCGAAVAPAPPPPPPPSSTGLELSVAEGVVEMEGLCEAGAAERCDALDSDCDGSIDEGCEGTVGAPVEVAVAWNAGADVDLVLTCGDEPRPVAASSLADCADPAGARIERGAIAEIAGGTECRIELRHTSACGHEGPLTATVSIALSGGVRVFNTSIAPGESRPIASVSAR